MPARTLGAVSTLSCPLLVGPTRPPGVVGNPELLGALGALAPTTERLALEPSRGVLAVESGGCAGMSGTWAGSLVPVLERSSIECPGVWGISVMLIHDSWVI